MSFKIKQASWKDYDYCYRLTKNNMFDYFVKHWGGWNSSMFRESYIPSEVKVLFNNNRRIGYYALKPKEGYSYLDNIQISKKYRGKGIGLEVMKRIETEVLSSKIRQIQLTVFKDNPAKRFYERLGYTLLTDKGTSVLMGKKIC